MSVCCLVAGVRAAVQTVPVPSTEASTPQSSQRSLHRSESNPVLRLQGPRPAGHDASSTWTTTHRESVSCPPSQSSEVGEPIQSNTLLSLSSLLHNYTVCTIRRVSQPLPNFYAYLLTPRFDELESLIVLSIDRVGEHYCCCYYCSDSSQSPPRSWVWIGHLNISSDKCPFSSLANRLGGCVQSLTVLLTAENCRSGEKRCVRDTGPYLMRTVYVVDRILYTTHYKYSSSYHNN